MLYRRRDATPASASRPGRRIAASRRGAAAGRADAQARPDPDADITARSRFFDGATDRQFDLGKHQGLAPITIDIRLRTKSPPPGNPLTTATSPEMPLAMGDKLSIYVMSNGYLVTLKDGEGELLLKDKQGDLSGFTRITIVSDAGGTVLYFDGVEVARSSKEFTILRRMRVGAGHKDRFWAGDMEFCDVYSLVKARTDFADRPDRFDDVGRIASLDA